MCAVQHDRYSCGQLWAAGLFHLLGEEGITTAGVRDLEAVAWFLFLWFFVLS